MSWSHIRHVQRGELGFVRRILLHFPKETTLGIPEVSLGLDLGAAIQSINGKAEYIWGPKYLQHLTGAPMGLIA